MGLMACDAADWLCVANPFSAPHQVEEKTTSEIALKRALYQMHSADISQSMAEAEDAIAEVSALIANNVSSYHPERVWRPFEAENPLISAALNIVEDILLLAPVIEGDTCCWTLKAGFVAFPAHWSLAEKMGKPIEAIHAPVPELDDRLGAHINRFFNNMLTDTITKRRNWTIQIDDTLFAPGRYHVPSLSQNDAGKRCYVRVEDQRIRKLPQTGWIVFTIRTSLAPIARWQDDKTALISLQTALSGLSHEMRNYRGVENYKRPLFDWIDTQIATLT